MKRVKTKIYKDTLHGFSALTSSKYGAWMLIRNKCNKSGLAVPQFNEIEYIGIDA